MPSPTILRTQDNADGTRNVLYSDYSTDRVNVTKNPDGTVTTTQIPGSFTAGQKSVATQLGAAGATEAQAQTLATGVTTGNTNAVGVPTDSLKALGSPAAPDPKTPIPAAALTGTNVDTNKVLGAGATYDPTSADVSGLLALYNTDSAQQTESGKLNTDLTTLMTSLGSEGADTQTALDANGVSDSYGHVRQLNLEAAQLKGELDNFDVQSKVDEAKLGEQAIPAALIGTQLRDYQKLRDLTRLAKASELANVISLSQAYQGNAELGIKLAEQSIRLKYAPIENQIATLKQQLTVAAASMSSSDAKRAKVVDKLLDIQKEKITAQKAADTALQKLGVQAASGGAPLALVKSAIATGDEVQASSILSKYLKGPTESVSTTGGGTGSPTSFTQTQKNKGAAAAGLSSADFAGLHPDVQNYFVNSASSAKAFNTLLAGVQDGTTDATEALTTIDTSNVPTAVKEYLKKKVQEAAPDSGGSGGFFSSIGDFFSNAWKAVSGG